LIFGCAGFAGGNGLPALVNWRFAILALASARQKHSTLRLAFNLTSLTGRENVSWPSEMPVKAKVKLGQPTKKNPLAVKRILKIAKSGLPLHFVAQAGDITRETLNQWRKLDRDFDRLLRAARLEAVERRWNRIEKAAMGSEERPPAWQADAWALERAYPQHFSRPETQLSVNQSVSTGPTNIVVVGPERAAILAARHESIRNKTRELLDKVRGGDGNQAGDVDPGS
jgi:hypothetical protein